MPIMQTHNFDVEMVFNELDVNYTDFLDFLKVKNNKLPTIKSETSTAIFVLDQFKEMVEKNGISGIKSSDTTRNYLSFVNRFTKYLIQNNKSLLFIDINEITFNDFVEYTNLRNNIKIKHGTFNTYAATFRRICTFAYENDFVYKNINYKFKKISFKLLPRYLNQKQITDFINEAKERRDPTLWVTVFITFLGTGLRISELANLRVEDFDVNNKLIYTLGKGGKERYIPLYPQVERAVLLYLMKSNTDIKNASGYLFSRQIGNVREKPICVRSIQYQFRKIANRTGLDNKFTPHSFRHTFAVNCLKAGMQLVYLSQIMGHESSSSTDTYTQLLPKDLQQVIEEKYPMPLEKLINQLLQ